MKTSTACAWVTFVAAIGMHEGAAWAAASQADAVSQRGVAALGRLEPLGGIVRVAAPSTPDAVSGAVVVKLFVDRGADVEAGQMLAEVDTTPITRARVAEADADLETARRDAVAAASLSDEACVLADVAARQSRRKGDLLVTGASSKEETETAQGNAEAAAASCKALNSAARVAESRIVSAQARLTERQAQLERTQVRAPFAGRVLDVHARPGELAGPNGILELGRVDQMYVIAEVYEADVRLVKVGQRARVHSDALGEDLNGAVTLIRPKVQKLDQIGDDPAARKDARIVEVEIRLEKASAAANLTNLQVEVVIGQ